ncbi:MAG TPA: SMP-30/gluconolactonase/LRE family protein [Burkholderiaceae bacterium]
MMELTVDSRCELGECILWCERTARLLWTDIQGERLWAHSPGTGKTQSWRLPERLGCFALTQDDDCLLLGLASRLASFRFSSRVVTTICEIEPGLLNTRINDGRCDRQGRFVFGTFNQNHDHAPVGAFYRLNRDLQLEALPLPKVGIANSICFSPDGGTMYWCDSPQKIIHCCDYGVDGRIANLRVFADLRQETGAPDGSTVDAEGYLWNARWGGSCLVRHAPDGSIDCVLGLPVTQPSCVTFGGPDLSTIYASTAWRELGETERAAQPLAGGVFGWAAGAIKGLPEQRFLGALS